MWDINGDDGTTANIAFSLADISSAHVYWPDLLEITLTSNKADAVKATSGYGAAGGVDKLDVSAGFIKDLAGNAATTDAVTNGWLSTTCWIRPADSNVISPTTSSQALYIGNISLTNAHLDASGVSSTELYVQADSGDIAITNIDTAGSNLFYSSWSGGIVTANITASGGGVIQFLTLAGNDTLTSTSTAGTTFNSGSGNDMLTGGSGDDSFKFANADFTAGDTIHGNAGNDTLWITGAATLTDAQFANVTSLTSIALDGGQSHSITLGANAETAFTGSTLTNPINIGIGNFATATSLTVDASAVTTGVTVNNKPNSGAAGATEVTGGSGDDQFIFGDGTATVHFAASAAANGSDVIYVTSTGAQLTLDFANFLGTTAVNTPPADFTSAGLDLSGANNLGVIFNQPTGFSASDIATSAAAGKVAVADNGKAVVLGSSGATATTAGIWACTVSYIEDTDPGADQTWNVTLIGRIVADWGSTANQIAAITFA